MDGLNTDEPEAEETVGEQDISKMAEETSTEQDTGEPVEGANAESEESMMEDNSVSIGVIGGADGPTSIFLAGKLGTGFKIAVTLMIAVPIMIAAFIIWWVMKRKSDNKKDR